jgi:hypothetical protein
VEEIRKKSKDERMDKKGCNNWGEDVGAERMALLIQAPAQVKDCKSSTSASSRTTCFKKLSLQGQESKVVPDSEWKFENPMFQEGRPARARVDGGSVVVCVCACACALQDKPFLPVHRCMLILNVAGNDDE